jgi:hypothetical protein
MSFTPATKTLQPPDCPQYVHKSPAQLQVKHTCPTRPDPLSGIWPQAETMLTAAPELEVKTDHGGNLEAEFKQVQQLLGRQEKPGAWRPSSSAWTGESIRPQRPRTKTKEPRMNHRSKPTPAPRPNPSGAPSSAHDRVRCPCTKWKLGSFVPPPSSHPQSIKMPYRSNVEVVLSTHRCKNPKPRNSKAHGLFGSRVQIESRISLATNIRWKNIYPALLTLPACRE